MTWQDAKDALAIAFGGRLAEELIFGAEKVTTGASSDIQQATALARRMVTEWGMSDRLGPLRYMDNEEEVFLGHSVTQRKNVSEATAQIIDEEIRSIVETANARARKILTDNLDGLHTLANALLEYETLSGKEIDALLRGETITRVDAEEPTDSGGSSSPIPTTGTKDRGHTNPGFDPSPQPES